MNASEEEVEDENMSGLVDVVKKAPDEENVNENDIIELLDCGDDDRNTSMFLKTLLSVIGATGGSDDKEARA